MERDRSKTATQEEIQVPLLSAFYYDSVTSPVGLYIIVVTYCGRKGYQ